MAVACRLPAATLAATIRAKSGGKEDQMPKIPDEVAECVNNALEDGTPCLLGTVSADGTPEISPKGSVLVHNSGTLAYWERSHRGALRNVGANPNVVVYYRNPARAEKLPQGAALRFYGKARIVEDAAEREAIMNKVVKRELDADPGRKGVAVVIALDRITNLRGDEQFAG